MLSNQDVLRIALEQSAYDCNCHPEDFLAAENVLTVSQKNPRARKYLQLPLACDMVSYGSNIVARRVGTSGSGLHHKISGGALL